MKLENIFKKILTLLKNWRNREMSFKKVAQEMKKRKMRYRKKVRMARRKSSLLMKRLIF